MCSLRGRRQLVFWFAVLYSARSCPQKISFRLKTGACYAGHRTRGGPNIFQSFQHCCVQVPHRLIPDALRLVKNMPLNHPPLTSYHRRHL